MKSRRLYLVMMGLGAAMLTGELFLSMREGASDSLTRKLNNIGEDEKWLIEGSFLDSAETRSAYQGPMANPQDFFESDSELGSRLRPNLRALPGRFRRGGQVIYDVNYSTNRFGWRVTPQASGGKGDVLFFGDSFTFGQGLADGETLPARFSAEMGGAVSSHNCGVPGWGAQQALRLLELSGEKPELQMGRVTKAFFLLASEHLPRLAGERPESAGSPRYEFKDGTPVLAGNYPDSSLSRLCGYSALCDWARSKATAGEMRHGETKGKPADLAALFSKAQEIIKERYHARLTVVSWDLGEGSMGAIEKELVAHGLDVVSIKDALPGFEKNSSEYLLQDGYPNSHSMQVLGKYLADRLKR